MAARAASALARYSGTKIVAIGKNYAKHVAEMGGKASSTRNVPVFFLKPNSSVIHEGSAIQLPDGIGEVHHEVELGVVVARRCRHVKATDWREYVAGYVCGLDLTARDLQARAKAAGLPWTHSKCYDTFTPLSGVVPADAVADPHALELYLSIDGVEKQRGRTADMLTRIPELLQAVTAVMTLEPGDVILTGTPEGVGPVKAGQTVTAGITGLVEMRFAAVDEHDA